jgi:competence protein ComEA
LDGDILKLNIKYIIAVILIIIVAMITYYFYIFPNSQAVIVNSGEQVGKNDFLHEDSQIQQLEIDTENLNNIKVYIAGEVINSGVYEVTEGSRIIDVLNLAGGTTELADLISINLAAFVHDAEQITIPVIKKYTENTINTIDSSLETSGSTQNIVENNLVNINTANKEQLMKLPNIGEVTATKILNYRENNGYFKAIENIKNVSGIGSKTFEGIKDLIIVN